MRKITFPLVVLLWAFGVLAGCSGSTSPVVPDNTLSNLNTTPSDMKGRDLFGVWEVYIDYDGIQVTDVTDRYTANHIDVKKFLKPPYCNDCLSFGVPDDDPVAQTLTTDVTIKNPFQIEGADIRGIVMSNNSEIYLANPDDYTKLHDPQVPPRINPSRRFGKTLPNGIVGSGTEVTETFVIHYDSLPCIFRTAVDAVWPSDSLREPYSIENQAIDANLDTSGSGTATISVEVYDRNNDHGLVSIVCEDLGINTAMIEQSTNHYNAVVSNTGGATAGDYEVLISAYDSVETNWVLYDYLTVTVIESVGEWVASEATFDSGGLRDLAVAVNQITGVSSIYYGSGTSVRFSGLDFGNEQTHFSLNNIDPKVPGFSPNPVNRIDGTLLGGIGLFSSSEDEYSDAWYTGPVNTLMVTIFPGIDSPAQYLNPGDGDAGRMYPSDSSLIGVDITDDMSGNIYGFWADPDGSVAPEMYGLTPDYTRHDIFMGGAFPPELIGDEPGKLSGDADNIMGFEIGSMAFDTGTMLFLENYGGNSEVEVIQFNTDFVTKLTTYTSIHTIDLGAVNARDIDVLMPNGSYGPNQQYETIAVLIDNNSSGGYLEMFDMIEFENVDTVGSASEPIINATPAYLDVDNAGWRLIISDDGTGGVTLAYVT